MSENEINLREARAQLGYLVDRAEHAGEITVLTRNGRPAAAIVPITLIPQESVVSIPPVTVTAKNIRTLGADLAAVGDADQLKAAFETDSPITLDGKLAGEVVYLGYTRQTYGDAGIVNERIGLDHTLGESPKFPGHTIAAYLIDASRLDGAPRLAEMHRKASAARLQRAIDAEVRAEEEDERLEGPTEEEERWAQEDAGRR